MLKLAALLTTLTATVVAQSPLVSAAVTGNNQGNIGGGIYFDIHVGAQQITVTDLAWMPAALGAGTSMDAMEIWMGPPTWEGNVTNAALWTNVTNTQPASLTALTLTAPTPLVTPICLAANTSYGIALKAAGGTLGFSHRYENGTGPGCPTSVPSGPFIPAGNQESATNELTMQAGAAQNSFLTGGVFCPRVWVGEIHYTIGACPAIAVGSNTTYGNGCYDFRTSYGELFPNPSTALDIADHSIVHQFAGTQYNVSATATPNLFTPPGGGALPFLNLVANDSVETVSSALQGPLPFPILFPRANGSVGIATDLEVCSSGFITPIDSTGATAPLPGAQPGDATPSLGEFFDTGLERWAPLWQGMVPNGTNVTAEVIGTTQLVITWNMVGLTAAGTDNTFQVIFDGVTSDVAYIYDTSTTGAGGGGNAAIIGLTQGNMALANEIDVSQTTVNPFSTAPVDNTAISIDLDARPVLGTSPNVVITGYDAPTTPLGVVVLSLTQINPGISLAGFGMPGCQQYVTPDAILSFITGGASQVSFPLVNGGIPTGPTFNGVIFLAQALSITGDCGGAPCNSLGVISSQGLRIFFGSL